MPFIDKNQKEVTLQNIKFRIEKLIKDNGMTVVQFCRDNESKLGVKASTLQAYLSKSKSTSNSLVAINTDMKLLGEPPLKRKTIVTRKHVYYR